MPHLETAAKAELERARAALDTVVATAKERDASIAAVSEGRDAAREEIEGLMAQRVEFEELTREKFFRLEGQLEEQQAAFEDESEQLQSQIKKLRREKAEEAQKSTLQLQQLRTELELSNGLIAQRVEIEQVANEEISRLKGQLGELHVARDIASEQLRSQVEKRK